MQLANGVACNGASDHLGLRHTKKVLLQTYDFDDIHCLLLINSILHNTIRFISTWYIPYNLQRLFVCHHKQAFLELLDQVKDAISVDASVSSDKEAYLSKSQDKNGAGMLLEANSVVNGVPTDPPENVNGTSSCHFLVLEACFSLVAFFPSLPPFLE